MRTRIQNILYRLRASFWFLPSLLASCAFILSFITTSIDKIVAYRVDAQQWWIYGGGADGARTVLSVIAGSMITVAGMVFSITIVVLSLASSQFGPRLIRNFMNVRANQLVMGTFVSTFLYCILVLRTVNASADARFVPGISVTMAIVMAITSLGVLIYFIHSVSESIQAQNIIARVCRDLDETVDRIFPDKIGQADVLVTVTNKTDYTIPKTCDREVCNIRAENSGYLQAVDNDALMNVATEENLLIHLGYRPGAFITKSSVLVTVWPGTKVNDKLSDKINTVFILGPERTLEQDAEFAIYQMVEIAVRALSPGINDPITAITCIDWLGVILCKLANRKMPPSQRYDEENRLRVIRKTYSFQGLVDAAFNMIRQNSESIPAVSIHLLETIATIADQTPNKTDREILLNQANLVSEGCKTKQSTKSDREDLNKRYNNVVTIIDEFSKDTFPTMKNS